MTETLLVITNVPDQPTALGLAEKLVELGVAACVNCLPGVQSVYRWQGKTEQAMEVTLFIKTQRDRYEDLQRALQEAHPYDGPK